MKFTDGMEIDTNGEYRVICKSDGLYVVGHGTLCYVRDQAEADKILAILRAPKGAK